MDYLIGLLNSILNNPLYVKWAIYAIAALAGVTLAVAISFLISGIYSPIKTRLRGIQSNAGIGYQKEVLNTLEHRLGRAGSKSLFNFSNDASRKSMIHAGFHSENALALFNGIRLMAFLVAAIASIICLKLLPDLSNIMSFYLSCVFFVG